MPETTEEFALFESQLQDSLHPIQADPRFVGNLRKRLMTQPSVLVDPVPQPSAFLWVSIIILGIALVLFLLRKRWEMTTGK